MPTADKVIRFTHEINEKSSSRKSRRLATHMNGVLISVQQYCSAVDIPVQGNETAMLVWGTVKLVILAASNFSDYFEKLSAQFAQLGSYFPRFNEYDRLFANSTRLQRALADFYAVVVIFCSRALGVIQEKGIKQFANSIWKTFKHDFGSLQDNLSVAKDEVDEEIKLASEQSAHNMRELQQIEFRENHIYRSQQLTEIEENKVFRSQQKIALAETKELGVQKLAKDDGNNITSIKGEPELTSYVTTLERRKVRLLQKVSNYDYTASLRQTQRKRCQNTGLWFFECVQFKRWIEGDLSKCLSCSGTTGCGKTILTGHVIDYLKKILASKQEATIVYYFFDFTRKESLSILTFLRSILQQMIRLEHISPELEQKLKEVTLKNTFIIIDGADETENDNFKFILQFLNGLQQYQAGVKLFIASTLDIDAAKMLDNCQTIHIKPSHLQTDIETFINSKLQEESVSKMISTCDPALLDNIKQFLRSGAQGMFLWVDLIIKAICDSCEDDQSLGRIPELLSQLPKDVMGLYSRALKKVLGTGDQKEIEVAKKAFQWIIFARRPMSIGELEEAAAITTDQRSWKELSVRFPSPSRLSKICGNLVTFDEAEKTVSLAHHTVQSFFSDYAHMPPISKFHFQPDEIDSYFGDTCIT
ncbi:MAG: hypothetical protein M1834_004814 [Cirrosporium novae-zelandiae]|nr:MAG: hypothetical protein M1834_004814 [Cirrosporium novae-zelandiae]